jgi:hypothetical protein
MEGDGMRWACILPLLLIAGFARAYSATQTDWSGGDGVWGPVIDWGDEFYMDSGANWYVAPGEIRLTYLPIKHMVDDSLEGAACVYAEDVNGDGYMDVLGAGSNNNTITWYENDDSSGTSWTKHVIDDEFMNPVTVYGEDVNGDGHMDVIGASCWTHDITWWENDDGSGTSWTEHVIDSDFKGSYSVYAEDVNGDGYMDVLGASYNDGQIAWWENDDGSGTSWTEHMVDAEFVGAQCVYAGDVLSGGVSRAIALDGAESGRGESQRGNDHQE